MNWPLLHRWQKARTVAPSLYAFLEKPYSHLLVKAEGSGWVLDEEAQAVVEVSRRLGFHAHLTAWAPSRLQQCVHYTSQFAIRDPAWIYSRQRLSIDYFHGLPQNDPLFADGFERIRKIHGNISRIRVSHSQMEEVILSTGVAREKVHRIPIGLNLQLFSPRTPEASRLVRDELSIPSSAVVIGSFQKDGIGWGEGFDPKRIKGPDVFISVIRRLKEKIPELWVLLTGPSRGFVKKGLESSGVPFVHRELSSYGEVGRYYHALDAYLVTSREEGGPKAILESMASGVPLITTRVGQARDLVRHGFNGWMVESEDIDGLAQCALNALGQDSLRRAVVAEGLKTAAQNSYVAQEALWRKYLNGFVES